MTKVEQFLEDYYKIYEAKQDYSYLKQLSLEFVDRVFPFMLSVEEIKPEFGARCVTLHDLSSTYTKGQQRGKFLKDLYYNNNKFVEHPNYDDGYGFITHWISFEELEKLL